MRLKIYGVMQNLNIFRVHNSQSLKIKKINDLWKLLQTGNLPCLEVFIAGKNEIHR